ncbi:MAG: hypothetical protein CSA58_00215 [Micrococcales bacterium]|nr:MAG: hypothetical protein CSB46_08095 [Micrococcales bacterium]PIE28216.1 MAG: hypothetical protein CSA58_00215 [Micrococcales bacterium]
MPPVFDASPQQTASVIGAGPNQPPGGHSRRTLVAGEIARRLTASGWSPALVVSGHDAPSHDGPRRAQHRRPDEQLIADLVCLDEPNAEVFAQPALVMRSVSAAFARNPVTASTTPHPDCAVAGY